MVQYTFDLNLEPDNGRNSDFDLNLPSQEAPQEEEEARPLIPFKKALGFSFQPSDLEILLGYLKPYCQGEDLPENNINITNIYRHHPQQLAEEFPRVNDKDLLFFTPRRKASRTADGGFWHTSTGTNKIRLGDNIVGEKQNFVFYNGALVNGKPPKEGKTNWLMIEYRLKSSPMDVDAGTEDINAQVEIVLAKIYNNKLSVTDEEKTQGYEDFIRGHQKTAIEHEKLWETMQKLSV